MKEGVCRVCGKPYAIGDTCPYCKDLPRGITRVQSLFPYEGRYKESIFRWKYNGIRKYAKGFGWYITKEIEKNVDVGIEGILPIPIDPRRLRRRGFNQARDLATIIGTHTGIPVYDVLERTSSCKPQSACTKEERHHNIRNTIALTKQLPDPMPKTWLLIDDIYTTGSTIGECIRILKESTDEEEIEVYVWTVCMAI